MTEPISTDLSEWGAPLRFNLNEREAYDAMLTFLTNIWLRGDKSPMDIAVVLGFINRNTELNLAPCDIAQWDDWLAAIRIIKRSGCD